MNTHRRTGHIQEVGDGIEVYLMPFRGMDCDIGHCVINAKLRRDHQKVNNNHCRV
jgi:hypothetical protein